MRTFLHGLFARLAPPADGDPGDDQLLAAFLAARGPLDGRGAGDGDAAFQQIVRRHGPMVHGVCRRLLRNEADADDAFQAVFLVLLRKADRVRPGNMLGNWLYGVAVNVARKGRELAARRARHERASVAQAPAADAPAPPDGGLREVIDEELSRLPAAYRAAVVACDLEGRTRREAAGRLGWSEGTVASRLARGRGILADRLSRRGVALPAAGLGAALAPDASAAVPRVTLAGHSEAVEALAREAARALWVGKAKSAAVAVLAVVGLAGVGAGAVVAFGTDLLGPAAPDGGGGPAPAAKSDAGGRKVAKPTRFVLTNPAGDITVVSDRDEPLAAFFRRQQVMVATVPAADVAAARAASKPSDRLFVAGASYNGDAPRVAAYGSFVRLAPLDPELAAMIREPGKVALVMVADPKAEDVWHAAGFTTRPGAAFFASKERKPGDDFAPADLLHAEKK